MSEHDLDELRAELDGFAKPKKKAALTAREERIIAGFEDIQRFVEENGRPPSHGEDGDIFERLYAVRLDRLRELTECRELLTPFDRQGLLGAASSEADIDAEAIDYEALRAELGSVTDQAADITELRHVKSRAEIRAAEEIANRQPCDDFDRFKPLFKQIQAELDEGDRETRPFGKDAEIKKGDFFILGGQIAHVAEMGEEFVTDYERKDRRLRVIYSNGTESDLLLRSLQRALYKDEAGRRITDPSAGPLFSSKVEDDDTESGTIYVLRSLSDHPDIATERELIHKIGVTGGKLETRLANAKLDPTFLMAEVEVVATYKLYNINRTKLENLIHRIFASARLDLDIRDRFGHPIKPREWFLVPLDAINEAVERIQDGTIADFSYDPSTASLKRN
ncbi:MAG: GIY-YIG nuclease family protein [Pseudomonadota bacterium]